MSCKTFSVKWSCQPLRRLGLISSKPSSHENNLMFFMSCKHFLLSRTFTSLTKWKLFASKLSVTQHCLKCIIIIMLSQHSLTWGLKGKALHI